MCVPDACVYFVQVKCQGCCRTAEKKEICLRNLCVLGGLERAKVIIFVAVYILCAEVVIFSQLIFVSSSRPRAGNLWESCIFPFCFCWCVNVAFICHIYICFSEHKPRTVSCGELRSICP